MAASSLAVVTTTVVKAGHATVPIPVLPIAGVLVIVLLVVALTGATRRGR